ncbi:MAG: DUF1549 domain-containing protein [Verrucomicrobia bacterium]|nr:DUF1549 domain-containing protein [Verrucomicrobiota bacterium]
MKISPIRQQQCLLLLLIFVFAGSGYANPIEPRSKQGAGSFKGIPISTIRDLSRQIDDMLVKDCEQHDITPNPLTSDSAFLRRVFLDIVGRIPTYEEAKTFLDSREPAKRSQLIDHLLNSEGYVSREFNYWADLLRIQSRMQNVPGQPYIDWLKDSLRENKPYDRMVRELIGSEGYIWENGAAGYYLRDAGMPLDHMANTFQVFLGTQLVCAQCHDHPFDDWTQRAYYEQAAFIYGVKTADPQVNRRFRAFGAGQKNETASPETMAMARRLVRPLRYRVNETQSRLRLPDDYKYNDAEPKALVEPRTIFGDAVDLKNGESPRDAYANWLTSPNNPRFSTVIANRLWKRAMGVGLIEPVDDVKEDDSASNAELMEFLSKLVRDLDFDLKQYCRVLYNTRAFQRQATTGDLVEGDTYRFPGPTLERMSAEHLWDSLVGLIVPDVDERAGVQRPDARYSMAKDLLHKNPDEILAIAEEQARSDNTKRQPQRRMQELQKSIREAEEAGDRTRVSQLRDEVSALRRNADGAAGMLRAPRNGEARKIDRQTDSRWKGFPSELVRASEIQSPAPPQHFLRQFGQSDRETIENANREANVPQILTLLNGPVYSQLTKPNSLFYRNLAAAPTPLAKLQVVFLSILSRNPTVSEANALVPELESRGRDALADISWALINTREFAFIQ